MIKQSNSTIPIFFTIDDAYAPWLSVALISMIENASLDYHYHIYILFQQLSEENMRKIIASSTENHAIPAQNRKQFEVTFCFMGNQFAAITDRKENRLRCDYFTMTIFYRLFIPDFFTQFDKAIYIDSDIVIPGDISELYQIDLGDNIVGACPDHSVSDIPEFATYMEHAIGVNRYQYVNSGVLLMNLQKMREKEFSYHFLSLLNAYHFDCIAPDQDYLNAMCHNQILFLNPCWDTMPNENEPAITQPKLIHYNLFAKPWCYDDIPYKDYFWNYAKQSAYYSDILLFKETYGIEQKDMDKKHLNALLQKAATIPEQDITFRKMRERGVKIDL